MPAIMLRPWAGPDRPVIRSCAAGSSRRKFGALRYIAPPPDPHTATLHVPKDYVHLRGPKRIVESIVLRQQRQTEVGRNRRVAQIEFRPGRSVAVFALVIEFRDVNQPVGQMNVQPDKDVLVEHANVEGNPVTDQWSTANEVKERGQDFVDRLSFRHVRLAQMVNLDGVRFHRRIRPHKGAESLAGQDTRAPDFDRCDADDVIGKDIEAAGLTVERDDFAAVIWLEKERIAGVGQQLRFKGASNAPANFGSHQNTLK